MGGGAGGARAPPSVGKWSEISENSYIFGFLCSLKVTAHAHNDVTGSLLENFRIVPSLEDPAHDAPDFVVITQSARLFTKWPKSGV